MPRKKIYLFEVYDTESKNYVLTEKLLDHSTHSKRADLFKLRYKVEELYKQGKPKYLCPSCKQPLKLRGTPGGLVSIHFYHIRNLGECALKDENRYTRLEIKRMKYQGAKESYAHLTLKRKLAESLITTPEVREVYQEKTFKSLGLDEGWKRPDISFKFKGHAIVLELQLSTTFLDVVVGRDLFYRQNNASIIWIFQKFDLQTFLQNDIFYNHNQNAFVFDPEAETVSIKHKELYLKVYYPKVDQSWIETEPYSREEIPEMIEDIIPFKSVKFREGKSYYFDVEHRIQSIEFKRRGRNAVRELRFNHSREILEFKRLALEREQQRKRQQREEEFEYKMLEIASHSSELIKHIETQKESAFFNAPSGTQKEIQEFIYESIIVSNTRIRNEFPLLDLTTLKKNIELLVKNGFISKYKNNNYGIPVVLEGVSEEVYEYYREKYGL